MKNYNQVLLEAKQFNIRVDEQRNENVRVINFYRNKYDIYAWMIQDLQSPYLWHGYSLRDRYPGIAKKGFVADWCLDRAVNDD